MNIIDRLATLSSEIGAKVRELISLCRDLTLDLLKNSDVYLEKIEVKSRPTTITGVDGSSRILLSIGGLHIVAINVSKVVIDKELKIVSASNPFQEVFYVNDPGGDIVEDVMKVSMLLLESYALRDVNTPIVMIDGPIVDPPKDIDPTVYRYVVQTLKLGVDTNTHYHIVRARIIRNLVEKGIQVIGIVKRISSENLFTRYIMMKYRRSIPIHNDRILVPILLHTACIEHEASSDYFVYTTPIPYNYIEVCRYYRDCGLNIMSMYIARCGTKPIRVDVAVTNANDLDAHQLTSIVASYLLPGSSIPIPVMMAHLLCTKGTSHVDDLASLIVKKVVEEVREFASFLIER